MDNLTHSLVGLLIARAAPGPVVPRAAALCVIAANIPDIDIVSMYDAAAYLVYHRHITHALVAIPVMAALAVCLVNVWGRRASRAELWRQLALASAAVGSHVGLDMMNSYGMRLWLPFSAEWSSWDLFFIIDPLIWVILATAVLLPRRIGGQRITAVAGLAAIVCYGGVKLWIKTATEAEIVGALLEPVRWRLFPAPWSPWDWLAYGRNASGEYFIKVPDVSYGVSPIPKTDPAVLSRLQADRLGGAYLQFARFPVVVEGSGEIALGDIRFLRQGPQGRIPFSCRFDVDQTGKIANGRFAF